MYRFMILLGWLTTITSCQQNKNTGSECNARKPYAKFYELPINSIKPQGWLKQFLINQSNGLTGHLENAGYPFTSQYWGADTNTDNRGAEKWWPYEQNGYWLDGMIRCGYFLDDTFLIKKAQKQIDAVWQHPDSTGYLGPQFMKPGLEHDRWAHAVFFRSMQAEYSATQNPQILQALINHFNADTFSYSSEREAINIETILWAYEKSGQKELLSKAETAYNNWLKENKNKHDTTLAFLFDKPSIAHGVTYNETAKLGVLLYMFTGKEEYLRPSVEAYKKIDKYHMMVDGVNVSSEKIRYPVNALSAHETCDITDYAWTLGYLLMATGNTDYADKIERAIFNAAPSVVTADFKALQYFSSPNTIVATHNSNHCPHDPGNASMSYCPNPMTECCPGNVNRMMPVFVSRLWLKDASNGLVAAMYAPSSISTIVGPKNTPITIDEITNYPFSDRIQFVFKPENPVAFGFSLRVPNWCTAPELSFNGSKMEISSNQSYITINQKFKFGDTLTLLLPQQIKLTNWPDSGISVERGPLVYALKIEEDWKVDTSDKRSTSTFPAYNLFPASTWNYALCINPSTLGDNIRLVTKPMTDNPWSIQSAPLELIVQARKVEDWNIIKTNTVRAEAWKPIYVNGLVTEWVLDKIYDRKGNFIFTPPLPNPETLPSRLSKDMEEITLVPYGCTKLRITIFPKCPNN